MSDIIVDSCVVAKWILCESDSAEAKSVLTSTMAQNGCVVVLDLAFAEVANAIWKRFHRGLLTAQEADDFLSDLETLPVTVETSRKWLGAAMAIAKQFDRSIYDALFVAATRGLGYRGVTSDMPLHTATAASYPEIVLLRDW